LRLLVATDSLRNGGAERQLSLILTNLPEQCFGCGIDDQSSCHSAKVYPE